MSLAAAVLLHLAVAVVGVVLTWLLQLRTKNAGVIDAVWPALVGAAAVVYAGAGPGDLLSRATVAAIGSLWALRLGGYLAMRNVGKPEDRRYAELRRKWGPRADAKMLRFFLFQALMAWLMGLTFLPACWGGAQPPLPWLLLGCSLGTAGIVGEALADHQLNSFRRDPANRGKVCDRGLWRYSRHPNYFFECIHWLVYPCLSVAAPNAWLSLIGPLLIALLLLKLSGIPTVEAADASRRRAGYDDYVRRTSAFIPLPPKQ